MLRIYNSKSKKLENFIPINKSQIKIYICGPTVYDDSHIGHARTYISFDIIRSILENYFNYNVMYVMNITDIDDKIILKSKQQNLSIKSITEKYTKDFLDDMRMLNVKMPTVLTKVSEYIGQIQAYIDKLIDKGFAYESGGSVYFDVERYKQEYSYPIFVKDCINESEEEKLDSNKNVSSEQKDINLLNKEIKENNSNEKFNLTKENKFREKTLLNNDNKSTEEKSILTEERNSNEKSIITEENKSIEEKLLNKESLIIKEKKHIKDFALWKNSEDGYSYKSGKGRPGWHIECSVMSTDTMGQDIDIHAGGIDLKFPHHENEVAQCQAYFNKKWCNYFMHTGHLNINGLKMSKSLKNFTTIKSILTKCSPIQLRILFLYHHWNSDMSYEEEQLKFAESVEKKIFNFVENVNVVKDSVDNIVKDNISDRLNSVDNVYINKLSTKIKDMKIEEKAAAGKKNSNFESSVNSVDNKNISSSKDSITKTNNNFSKCSFISSDDNQVLDKLSSTLSTIHFSYCNNFDTPSVMKSILELISFTRTKNIKKYTLNQVQESIKKHLRILGLVKKQKSNVEGIPEILNDFRSKIRNGLKHNLSKSEMFKYCDSVRNEVQSCGYVIEDVKDESFIKEM